jgi:hypothetical protein
MKNILLCSLLILSALKTYSQCTVQAGPDLSACLNTTKQLSTTTSGTGTVIYSWVPASGLNDSTLMNPTAHIDSTITYIVTASFSGGCIAKDTITINAHPYPIAEAGRDTTICKGQSAIIGTPGTGAGYLWSPGGGISAQKTVTPATTSSFILTFTSFYGCSDKDTVTVNVLPSPTANGGSDLTACLGDTVQLGTSNAQAGETYSWSPTTGLISPNASKTKAILPTTGLQFYTLTVTDSSSGCFSSDNVMYDPVDKPSFVPGYDKNICSGEKVILGQTYPPFYSYSWSPAAGLDDPNSETPLANPLATTTYVVTIANFSCSLKDTIIVNRYPATPPTANAGSDLTLCAGSSAIIGTTDSIGYTYTWLPSANLNNPGISNPSASPNATTNYTLTVNNSYGCFSTDVVKVTVVPGASANAGSDKIVCYGASTPIGVSPTAGYLYSWSPSDHLDNAVVSNPSASPLNSALYVLTSTNSVGCTAKDTVSIIVDSLSAVIIRSGDTLISTPGIIYQWLSYGNIITDPHPQPQKQFISWPSDYSIRIIDVNGCQATSNIISTPERNVEGFLKRSSGANLQFSPVLLLKMNRDSTVTVMDWAVSDATGYYQLKTIYSSAYVLALPDSGQPTNQMPTYQDSKLVIQESSPLIINSDVSGVNFSAIKCDSLTGTGYIGGTFTFGAGVFRTGASTNLSNYRMAQIASAGAEQRIFLIDSLNHPARTTLTDLNGNFSFPNLPNGKYKIWIDRPYIDNSNSPIITLTSANNNLANLQYVVEKTSLTSNVTNVTKLQNGVSMIESLSLYPNPFNKKTFIQYSLKSNSAVKLEVFNMLGEKEETLFNGTQPSGDYSFDFNSNKSGIFFLNVEVDGMKNVKRIVCVGN